MTKQLVLSVAFTTSILTLLLGHLINRHIDDLFKFFIDPFFSMDLDRNGEPDLDQLKNYSFKWDSFTFPLGHLLYSLLSIAVKTAFIIYLAKMYLRYAPKVIIK